MIDQEDGMFTFLVAKKLRSSGGRASDSLKTDSYTFKRRT
jgi:hypothetical protein